MGSGRWDSTNWSSYASTKSYSTKTVDAIYSRRTIHADLNPHGVKIRESRDSEDNPQSTPLIVALDVTGSMGSVLDSIAKKGLNTLATEIYTRKPITDPHIMFMGIGDVAAGDDAPLQTTQFEADLRIAQQLENIFFEKRGGGNDSESYALAWYFAGMHTATDSFEKRNKKGYLFTVGDEMPTPGLTRSEIERVLGYAPESDYTTQQLLTLALRQWEVFHIIIEEGSFCSSRPDSTFNAWLDILGQRALRLSDHTKLAEVIVSTLQVCEGHHYSRVIDSWDGSTSLVVKHAINTLDIADKKKDAGIVRL
jgi:hypothetical protein